LYRDRHAGLEPEISRRHRPYADNTPAAPGLVLPKVLFVSKACVACHAINGIKGRNWASRSISLPGSLRYQAFTHDPEMQKSLLAAEITNNIKDLIE
jgi:hypothetical protein